MKKGQFISKVEGTNMRLANLTFTGEILGYVQELDATMARCKTSVNDGIMIINIEVDFEIKVAPRTPVNSVIIEFDHNGVGTCYARVKDNEPEPVVESSGEPNDVNDEAFGSFDGFDY